MCNEKAAKDASSEVLQEGGACFLALGKYFDESDEIPKNRGFLR